MIIANLTLMGCEWKYMSSLNTNSRISLSKKSIILRYVDDLLCIDCDDFDERIPYIYPPSLKLNKTNPSNDKIAFLDLELDMEGSVNLYDKRQDFKNQKLIFFFNSSSNISKRIMRNLIINQIVRYSTIVCNQRYLSICIKEFYKKLIEQNFERDFITENILKVYDNHANKLLKHRIYNRKLYKQFITATLA